MKIHPELRPATEVESEALVPLEQLEQSRVPGGGVRVRRLAKR